MRKIAFAALLCAAVASPAAAGPLQIAKVSSAGNCVALTFDDGPDPTYTPQLLATLAERRVPATFFVLGSRAATWPELVAREHQEGNEVANHTWDHQRLTSLSSADALREMTRTDDILTRITGRTPTLTRAPYGALNESVATVAARTFVGWSVDTRDWETPNVDHIVATALAGASDGAIILLHDIHPKSVEAVPAIIDGLRERGYRFGTVSQLLAGTCGSSDWRGGSIFAAAAPRTPAAVSPQPVRSTPPQATGNAPKTRAEVQPAREPLFPVLANMLRKPAAGP